MLALYKQKVRVYGFAVGWLVSGTMMCLVQSQSMSLCNDDVVSTVSNGKYAHMFCVVIDVGGVVCMQRVTLEILFVSSL